MIVNIEAYADTTSRVTVEQDYPTPVITDYAAIDGQVLREQPGRFLNRELSWLAFNRRVLEEAQNPRTPLFERVRFLSIAASNQEEFFMVRVAGLKHQIRHGVSEVSADGLTPLQQLNRIDEQTEIFAKDLQETWIALRGALQEEGVVIIGATDMHDNEKEKIAEIFSTEIFPVLTPIAVDSSHPFPFVPNRGMALALEFSHARKNDVKCLIVLPSSLPRFFRLPGPQLRYMLIEDMILAHIGQLLPDTMELKHHAVFRVLRDSELEIDDDAEDLMQTFESAIKRRRRGNVIRLTIGQPVNSHLFDFLRKNLGVSKEDVLFFSDLVGLAHVRDLINAEKPQLLFPSFEPRYPQRIRDFEGNCFAAIKHKDIIVHHPYESFDVVVKFLQQAARDPDVISIKQTIYRTSSQSPIIEALIEAAGNGKSVTALVELKARFDEEANLRWARDMEKAGIQVILGIKRLKTHAKVTLVTRREAKKINTYAHFGTGNYHPDTARVYSDLSLFTCDKILCRDAMLLFNYMTVYAVPKNMERLSFAPVTMRPTLNTLIGAEIENAKKGLPAQIWLKCNSLTDPATIDLLYKASQVGVDIDLVIRGICMLRPGIKGLSEKIRVWSMVGRFLEHSRIYCFANGQDMPSTQARVFIASGDIMRRNLDHRIEAMVEITNATVQRQVLEQIMVANLKDQRQSWLMQPDGAYLRVPADDQAFSAQEYFIKNSSLSGRGKTLSNAPMPPALTLDRKNRKKHSS